MPPAAALVADGGVGGGSAGRDALLLQLGTWRTVTVALDMGHRVAVTSRP